MSRYIFIQPDLISTNMFGDEEMIKTFIGMYLTHCRADFDNLSQAIDQQNLAEVGSKAHHIKPTMAYIGAKELHAQFQEIETFARSGSDVSVIVPLFQALERNFVTVMQELDHFHTSLS